MYADNMALPTAAINQYLLLPGPQQKNPHSSKPAAVDLLL